MCSGTLLAAISPCPNDTFCFQPWAEEQIVSSHRINLSFHDIETLNRLAKTSAPYDLSKLSTACLKDVEEKYVLLTSGAVFAIHRGPKLIARRPLMASDLHHYTIAVPGKNTSAFAALSVLCDHLDVVIEMPSSEIIPSVVQGQVDAGVVIHEGRSVYQAYGLHEIMDLGHAYFSKFSVPLPLGVIVAKRSLGFKTLSMLSRTLEQSIQKARCSASLSKFVLDKSGQLCEKAAWQHIQHYVTAETERLSSSSEQWIQMFLSMLRSR